jgi:transcriptional regulator with AbiEi antitoxin domain of type IV toxin-antitoxin system
VVAVTTSTLETLPSPPLSEATPFQVAAAEAERLLTTALARRVVGDVLVAVAAPDSLAVRCAAARLLLPPPPGSFVVGFGSAAWLLAGAGAVPAPGRLDVVIPPGRRRPVSPVLRVRQVPLPASSVVTVGGVPVTTPVRTAADVARDLPPEVALPALRRLGELAEVRPHQVLTELNAMRYARGAATGRRVVRRWAEER